jgi:hypothetical protein
VSDDHMPIFCGTFDAAKALLERAAAYAGDPYEGGWIYRLVEEAEADEGQAIWADADTARLVRIVGRGDALLRAADLLAEVDRKGRAKVSEGVYVQDKWGLIDEQTEWLDGDEAKSLDFTGRPYWLTTDSGTDPIGIADAKDLADELAKIAGAPRG